MQSTSSVEFTVSISGRKCNLAAVANQNFIVPLSIRLFVESVLWALAYINIHIMLEPRCIWSSPSIDVSWIRCGRSLVAS